MREGFGASRAVVDRRTQDGPGLGCRGRRMATLGTAIEEIPNASPLKSVPRSQGAVRRDSVTMRRGNNTAISTQESVTMADAVE
jgi:hypothetical protein